MGSMRQNINYLLRILQFAFGVTLLGTSAWLIKQARDAGVGVPRALITVLVFSVLATIFSLLYFITARTRSRPVFYFFSFIDFVHFVGYVTSAGLLRKNFNGPSWQNSLTQYLTGARRAARLSVNGGTIASLVKLIAGLTIIQIILFFATMILSYLATRYVHDAVRDHPADTEKRGFFSRLSGQHSRRPGTAGSHRAAADPVATV